MKSVAIFQTNRSWIRLSGVIVIDAMKCQAERQWLASIHVQIVTYGSGPFPVTQ